MPDLDTRDEIARLMLRVYLTNAEIHALAAERSDRARERADQVVSPLVDRLRVELVALEESWPAEWRPALTAWCDAWRQWRDDPDAAHEPDRMAEEIGLVLGVAGAKELRHHRALTRAPGPDAAARARTLTSRRIAARYVSIFGETGDPDLIGLFERSEEGQARRDAIGRMAVETRISCSSADASDPLRRPLLDIADALLGALVCRDLGSAIPGWARVERAVAVLARTLDENLGDRPSSMN